MNRSARLFTAVLSCVLLSSSACSGGDDDSSRAGTSIESDGPVQATGESTSSATSPPTSAPTTPAATIGTDPCELLTASEVDDATGLTVLEVRNEPPNACVYDFGPDVAVAIFVSIDDGQGRSTTPADVFQNYSLLIETGDAEAITDLGVGAVYAPGFRGIAIDVGDGMFLALGVNGGYSELAEPREALIALAQIAVQNF